MEASPFPSLFDLSGNGHVLSFGGDASIENAGFHALSIGTGTELAYWRSPVGIFAGPKVWHWPVFPEILLGKVSTVIPGITVIP